MFLTHGAGAKLVSNWKQNMLYTKSKQTYCRKRVSIVTDLKVSPLTCKSVFYRPECNAKGGTHVAELWRSWNAQMKDTTR